MKRHNMKVGKRFSPNWLFLIFCLCWPAYVGAAAPGEPLFADLNRFDPGQREKRLIDGAKKEGMVVVYSSENINLLQNYQTEFAKRYPFITVKFWRAGGDRVGARVMWSQRGAPGYRSGLAFRDPVASRIRKALWKLIEGAA